MYPAEYPAEIQKEVKTPSEGAGETQAQSSVHYEGNETTALASSQGKVGGGVAQTQVSGTYTGGGSFSAQAQTSDSLRGAQSQIQGGNKGATSTAQGRAGTSQTQAQVQLGTETGATIAESQTSGSNFATNTQVQAGTAGGLADAQSKGTGSTSSQAQIGFLPYDGSTDDQKTPYKGGGTASAQSSGISGQSQSQIEGSFRYGIKYSGAAQAGSGVTGLTFPKLSVPGSIYNATNLLRNSHPNYTSQSISRKEVINANAQPKNGLQTDGPLTPQIQRGNLNNSHNVQHSANKYLEQDNSKTPINSIGSLPENTGLQPEKESPVLKYPTLDEDIDEDSYDEEYGDEEEDEEPPILSRRSGGNHGTSATTKTTPTTTTTTTTTAVPPVYTETRQPPTQTQQIILTSDNKHDTHIIQDSSGSLKPGDILQPGQEVPGTGGYTIPNGFRGRVTSVAGDKTIASAPNGGQAQTQTVVITPGSGSITVSGNPHNPYRSYQKFQQQPPSYSPGPITYPFTAGKNGLLRTQDGRNYDSFVTVTNSVTGQLNGQQENINKKLTHTYYTKSSTCGYFTFTCTAVSGSNGRTKICRPRPQTNPDGTPCGY